MSYRLGGERPANPYDLMLSHAWDLILELNGEHRERERIHGQRDDVPPASSRWRESMRNSFNKSD